MSTSLPAKLLTLVLLFALPLASSAAEPASLEFRDETFELAFVNVNRQGNFNEIINEYIPEGEGLEEWSSMLSVRKYPGRTDYRELADNVLKALKQQNPLAPSAKHTSADGKRQMIDFITWDATQDIVEFNVFIYELGTDGKSIIAQQYAQRAYGRDEGREFLTKMKQLRVPLLEAVGKFKFPKITTEQPAAE
ncbi:hypothetical protein ETAA8_10020 [Anatilimnocola aggregata]|uniref:Uncharacterized protein n=1 Tax=Anatilimnocola aggregata TaxID=2528021 RepID=A0A517Y6T2_9BACT|nr:hypothetical protein [Anatilimnocola aggregata]QDU25930.1 hypothetical protein ETAA8_10020 [Anatilimnocola aggregata]